MVWGDKLAYLFLSSLQGNVTKDSSLESMRAKIQ